MANPKKISIFFRTKNESLVPDGLDRFVETPAERTRREAQNSSPAGELIISQKNNSSLSEMVNHLSQNNYILTGAYYQVRQADHNDYFVVVFTFEKNGKFAGRKSWLALDELVKSAAWRAWVYRNPENDGGFSFSVNANGRRPYYDQNGERSRSNGGFFEPQHHLIFSQGEIKLAHGGEVPSGRRPVESKKTPQDRVQASRQQVGRETMYEALFNAGLVG